MAGTWLRFLFGDDLSIVLCPPNSTSTSAPPHPSPHHRRRGYPNTSTSDASTSRAAASSRSRAPDPVPSAASRHRGPPGGWTRKCPEGEIGVGSWGRARNWESCLSRIADGVAGSTIAGARSSAFPGHFKVACPVEQGLLGWPAPAAKVTSKIIRSQLSPSAQTGTALPSILSPPSSPAVAGSRQGQGNSVGRRPFRPRR